MSQQVVERRYLRYSAIGNSVVGLLSIVAAALSSSQSILLDGVFNLTYLVTGLFAIRVSTLVEQGDDERFPYGYAFFEPLINGLKGVLVFGVSIMALAGAVQALLVGGRPISAGTAVAYGLLASGTCWIVAYMTRRGATRTGSPLVAADAENWIVNAAISSCVLAAFTMIFVLRALGLDTIVPFVDPVVVLLVVLFSLGVPIRMAWSALMELLNRAPSSKIVTDVTRVIEDSLDSLPVEETFVRVVQPGRTRLVLVHVVVPREYQAEISVLDAARERSQRALSEAHLSTTLDMVFTGDRRWGAPLSELTVTPESA